MPQAFECKTVCGRCREAIQCRQIRRRSTFGTQPCKQHTSALQQRVAALPDAGTQCAALRFSGRLGALPTDVELPTMKRAPQAIALVAAKGQVSASVRAVPVKQPEGTVCIAEQNQVLPQQANRLHRPDTHSRIQRRIELIQQCHRLPILTQQVAAGCARPNAGDELIQVCLHCCIPKLVNGIPKFLFSVQLWA